MSNSVRSDFIVHAFLTPLIKTSSWNSSTDNCTCFFYTLTKNFIMKFIHCYWHLPWKSNHLETTETVQNSWIAIMPFALLALHQSNFQHRSGALCAKLLAYTAWTHSFTLLQLERLQGAFMATTGKGKKKHMIRKQMFGGSLDKKNPILPSLTFPPPSSPSANNYPTPFALVDRIHTLHVVYLVHTSPVASEWMNAW